MTKPKTTIPLDQVEEAQNTLLFLINLKDFWTPSTLEGFRTAYRKCQKYLDKEKLK